MALDDSDKRWLDEGFARLTGNVSATATAVEKVDGKLDQLNSTMADQRTDVARITLRVEGVETDVNALGEKVRRRVDVVDERLTALEHGAIDTKWKLALMLGAAGLAGGAGEEVIRRVLEGS